MSGTAHTKKTRLQRLPLPIALTQGDPAGVGPEIAIMLWEQRHTNDVPLFTYYGSMDHIKSLRPNMPIANLDLPMDTIDVFDDAFPVFDIPLKSPAVSGQLDVKNADQVINCLNVALTHIRDGHAAALVTGPIHKSVLYKNGFQYQGHTDFLAHQFGKNSDDVVMMLANEHVRAIPLTIHIPLKDVASTLSQELLIKTISIIDRYLKHLYGLKAPKLAVTGLNPHAGEDGTIGREEVEIITPALKALRHQGVEVEGPIAADTLFSANIRERYDAHITMYHDQALAPMKALDFDNGVNITLGLPIIRTSPDHGTALSLAGKFEASPNSTLAALKEAEKILFNIQGANS